MVVTPKLDRTKVLQGFGNAVRSRRIKLEISQEELGFRAGLHRTYIGSIERGERNTTLLNINRIALALQCNIADLVKQI